MHIYEENLSDAEHWKQEIQDHQNVFKQFIKPQITKDTVRSTEDLDKEAAKAREMFEAYEEVKMNVR